MTRSLLLRRRLLCAPEVIVALTQGKYDVVRDALPADARIVGVTVGAEEFGRIGGNPFMIAIDIVSEEFTADQPRDIQAPVIRRWYTQPGYVAVSIEDAQMLRRYTANGYERHDLNELAARIEAALPPE